VTFDFADIVTFTSVFELLSFIIFIILKARKPYYNKVLVIFFAFQTLGIISWILRKYNIYPDISNILFVFELVWAPSLFLYAEALTKQRAKPGIYWFYHGIPFLFFLVYAMLRLAIELPSPPIDLVVSIQVIGYNLAGLYILVRYHRRVKENFSKDEADIRNWVAVVLLGYALACLIPPIAYYIGIYQNQTIMVKEVISFLPFLIFYNILFFNAIGNPVIIHEIPKEEKYLGSQLTNVTAKQYLEKLNQVVESERCYLEPELTLGGLSKISGISSRYLSQIINQHKNKSFYDYINGLRTDYACKLLVTDSKKTILEILFESGFNSKTSFNTAFKKHTGLTPSQYKTKNRKNGSDS